MREVNGSRFAGIFFGGHDYGVSYHLSYIDAAKVKPQKAASAYNQLAVNWLYGAYVPKDAPLIALKGEGRGDSGKIRKIFEACF
jgi:hypothetical protein